MREHHPHAPQNGRGNLHVKFTNVPLEKSPDKILTPSEALAIRTRQKRSWESSAPPQFSQGVGACFLKVESAHLDERNPACECLGRLLEQLGRGASENEKARGRGPTIRKHAQY